MNYYEILGVTIDATQKEIKKAYRQKATELHPDTLSPDAAPSLKHLAEERFKELNHIYEVLSEPRERKTYNQEITEGRKYNLIQEISQLRDAGALEQAMHLAETLYGLFTDDRECQNIYAEVLYALAIDLSEKVGQASKKQVKLYLQRALELANRPDLKKKIRADLELLGQPTPPKNNYNVGTESQQNDVITTDRAVRLLKAGKAGIRAWNQFRQCESYVPSLAGMDLSGADLSQTNLQGVDLSQASLINAQLSGAIFDQANLNGADLMGAIADHGSFVGAQLQGVQWVDGSCKGVDFSNANLSKANFNHSHGQHSLFIGANLSGIEWIAGNLDETDCNLANFSGAVLTQTKAKKGKFTEAIFTNAHWEEANLTDANFAGANLERVDLSNASLHGVKFTRARLFGTNFNESTTCMGKNYSYIHHVGIDFAGADLSCATLVAVNLSKSDFSAATLKNTKFDHSDLGGSNLQNALISNTSFVGCNLRDADLTGTRFYFAHMDSHTNITGAKGI